VKYLLKILPVWVAHKEGHVGAAPAASRRNVYGYRADCKELLSSLGAASFCSPQTG